MDQYLPISRSGILVMDLYLGPGSLPWTNIYLYLGPGSLPWTNIYLYLGPGSLPWTNIYLYLGPGSLPWTNIYLYLGPGSLPWTSISRSGILAMDLYLPISRSRILAPAVNTCTAPTGHVSSLLPLISPGYPGHIMCKAIGCGKLLKRLDQNGVHT